MSRAHKSLHPQHSRAVFVKWAFRRRLGRNVTGTIVLYDSILPVLLTVGVIIAARFIWIYSTAYIARWVSPSLARRDPLPPWQWLFTLAFVGVRGVVSLAAALAIPRTTEVSTPFPHRDLILFITFGVIVVTLVGQGWLLPSIVRWLGLASHAADEHERERRAESTARSEALKIEQRRLEQLAAEREISPEVVAILRARHAYRDVRFLDPSSNELDATFAGAELRSELIAAEREYIYRQLQDGQITDEARRRIERELDLEEAGSADLPL